MCWKTCWFTRTHSDSNESPVQPAVLAILVKYSNFVKEMGVYSDYIPDLLAIQQVKLMGLLRILNIISNIKKNPPKKPHNQEKKNGKLNYKERKRKRLGCRGFGGIASIDVWREES